MVRKQPYNRKRYIIKPSYQIRLAFTVFAYILMYSLILGFIIFYPLYNDMEAAKTIEEQTMLSATVLYLHKRVWLGFFLVAALAGVQAIFSSHRVAGPMYRFEKMVSDLVAGNYGVRIKIRKKDEFKEMEQALNRLADTLGAAKAGQWQFYADAREKTERIRTMLEADGDHCPEKAKLLLNELARELESRESSSRLF